MITNINIGDDCIKLKPFNTNSEKDLLLHLSLNTDNSKYNIDDILELLGYDFKKYSINVRKYLLLKLRSISVSDIINIKFKCSNCNTNTEGQVDLTELKIDESKIVENEIYKEVYSDNINDYFIIDTDDLELDEYDKLVLYINDNKGRVNFDLKCKCLICNTINTIDISNDEFIINNVSEEKLEVIFKVISDMIFHGNYTKSDIDNMIPFERDIYFGLLEQNIKIKQGG